MANKRIDMLHLKQLLRLYTSGVSKLQISKQLGVSRNTVKKYINLYHEHRFTYQELQDLSDEDLNDLFGASPLEVRDQDNIHKVNDISDYEGMRTFAKVSFSKDKYDLEGNSHNYELDYDWEMKPRKSERNIPQTNVKAK